MRENPGSRFVAGVVTLFPEMFAAVTQSGVTRRALEEGRWSTVGDHLFCTLLAIANDLDFTSRDFDGALSDHHIIEKRHLVVAQFGQLSL